MPVNKLTIFIIAIIACFGIFLLLIPIAAWTFAYLGISGQVLSIGLVSLLGGCGGVLSAAQSGTLRVPKIDSNGDIALGMIQDLLFGVVGGIVIFMLVPSASAKVLKLGESSVMQISEQYESNSMHEYVVQLYEYLDTSQENRSPDVASQISPTDLDWIEIISLALIGGYGGQSLITRALASYATPDQVTQEIRAETAVAEKRRQIDQLAVNLFTDQIDVYTNAPDLAKLKKSIKDASPNIHQFIYVQARARAHLYMMLASQMPSDDERNALITIVASRLIPIMETLREIDQPLRKYRGNRFLLALAHFLLKEFEDASTYLEEAKSISMTKYSSQQIPEQYLKLEQRIITSDTYDKEFLHDLVPMNPETSRVAD